ncbi:MAG: efflux RND transporter periplasmic adaptor subunit [Candidatus Caenarcaniphilales bacterium]|nr:efflux RND transporter periplasmic adaptor subunit [Candidatus Caenarcaniphilales bacterium]
MSKYLICLAIFISSGCGALHKIQTLTQPKSKPTAEPPLIITESDLGTVSYSVLKDSFQASGELKPIQEALVSSEVNGKVLQLLVDEGDAVRQGQLLAVLDNQDLKDQYRQSEQDLLRAKDNLQLAKLTHERALQSFQEDLISSQELDDKRINFQIRQRELDNAKAALSLRKTALSKANVYAPVSGVISLRTVKAGQLALAGQELFQIVKVDTLKTELAIPSKYLSLVKSGQAIEVKVDGFPDQVFAARIAKINPVADPATRLASMTAYVPNPSGKLKANLYANSEVSLNESNPKIVIGVEALQGESEAKEKKVYIFNPSKKRITLRQIDGHPLESDRALFVVVEGLNSGEKYIKIPLDRVEKNLAVQVID